MKPKLIFFGTGIISRDSAIAAQTGFTIEAVITKPDSTDSGGRPIPTNLKAWAEQTRLPFYTPANRGELSDLFAQRRFESRLGLVVDYGIIIPTDVIARFAQGIVNSHFSLLPQWRGADPIRAAILSGQPVTGVSLFLITPALDEGELIAQAELVIPPGITTPELSQSLTVLSNKLVQSELLKYHQGLINPWPQDLSSPPTFCHKIDKSDGIIDWRQPAVQIERQIRAFISWPGSQTSLGGQPVILTAAHLAAGSGQPGKPLRLGADLAIYTSDDALIIDRLKPAGKAEMTGRAWLAGHHLP